jgi:hypothetical protein
MQQYCTMSGKIYKAKVITSYFNSVGTEIEGTALSMCTRIRTAVSRNLDFL